MGQVEDRQAQRDRLVQRNRLLAKLDRRGIHPINLVTAPAGFGKSTTVRQWLEVRDEPTVWIDLSPDDNDPSRLWSQIIDETIRKISLGVRARVALGGATGSVRPAIERLAEDLSATNNPVWIVLDDLHLIENQDCLGSIELAIGLFPPQARMILVSRSAPELPLQRYEGRGQLLRIGTADLAFDDAEILNLLVDAQGIPCSPRDADALRERTGGWPAALYMSALWLQDHPDSQGDSALLPKSERIVDFLMAEVLGGLDPEVREFLKQTSFLGWMSGELCDDVCGFSNSSEMLADVCRTNQLVEQDRNRPGWFRYHALMRDLLYEQLEREQTEDLKRLQRGAIDWYLGHEMIDAAAEMAIEAGEHDILADMLEANHVALSAEGRVATILRWGSTLPDDVLDKRATVTLVVALAAEVQAVSVVQIRRLLARVAKIRQASGPEWTPYHEAFWQILSALTAGQGVSASIASARIAVSCLEGIPEHQLVANVLLAYYLEISGQFDEAERLAREAVEDPVIETRPYFLIVALVTLAFIELAKGNLQASGSWVQESRDTVEKLGLQDTRMESMVCSVAASLAISRGDLTLASRSAEKSLRVDFEDPPVRVRMLLIAARTRALRGQTAQAEAALRMVDEILRSCPDVGRSLELRDEVQARIESSVSVRKEPLEPLSEAELRVLPLLENGSSRAAIAEELFLSVNTVKTHMRSIYRKLGASSREEAVYVARSAELIRSGTDSGPEISE